MCHLANTKFPNLPQVDVIEGLRLNDICSCVVSYICFLDSPLQDEFTRRQFQATVCYLSLACLIIIKYVVNKVS